jgi:hypothetical protein
MTGLLATDTTEQGLAGLIVAAMPRGTAAVSVALARSARIPIT